MYYKNKTRKKYTRANLHMFTQKHDSIEHLSTYVSACDKFTFNSLQPGVAYLYLLKTSENLKAVFG